MRQRLEQFLAAENISKAQFADKINVARAAISHIISGRNNPSYEFIVNTMDAFPSLNIEWLLKGNGKMYKSEDSSNSQGVIFPENDSQLFAAQPVTPSQKVQGKRAKKIVIFYDDASYEEFC